MTRRFSTSTSSQTPYFFLFYFSATCPISSIRDTMSPTNTTSFDQFNALTIIFYVHPYNQFGNDDFIDDNLFQKRKNHTKRKDAKDNDSALLHTPHRAFA